jgi:hypothetical protein
LERRFVKFWAPIHIFKECLTMATKFSVTLKDDVDRKAMVDALKKGAESKGLTFKGDANKGEATAPGAKITYAVSGNTADVVVDVGFPASLKIKEADAVKLLKEWLKPYTK